MGTGRTQPTSIVHEFTCTVIPDPDVEKLRAGEVKEPDESQVEDADIADPKKPLPPDATN